MTELAAISEDTLRHDLAACYRLVAHFGWDDLIATHISVKIPNDNSFLINPFGMLFDEITPADLVKVDMAGNILSNTDWGVNKAGFVIHSAIHAARDDAHCVMHLHTQDGVAVSMLEDGLLPLNQTAMLFAGDIAYHDFEGVAVHLDERERLATDLGNKHIMLLRNHGTLSVGATIAEAFTFMHLFETACTIQVKALCMGQPLRAVDKDVVSKVAAFRPENGARISQDLVWPAMIRKLDRLYPNWRG